MRDDARGPLRRRLKNAPLKEWEMEVRGQLRKVRARLNLGADAVIEDDLLVDEVLLLATPLVYRGFDTPIPAHRLDLVDIWVENRLNGEVCTADQREALARRIAPLPDEQLRVDSDGKYRPTDPRQKQVEEAVIAKLRRVARERDEQRTEG